jgi:hypothetical protein
VDQGAFLFDYSFFLDLICWDSTVHPLSSFSFQTEQYQTEQYRGILFLFLSFHL